MTSIPVEVALSIIRRRCGKRFGKHVTVTEVSGLHDWRIVWHNLRPSDYDAFRITLQHTGYTKQYIDAEWRKAMALEGYIPQNSIPCDILSLEFGFHIDRLQNIDDDHLWLMGDIPRGWSYTQWMPDEHENGNFEGLVPD